MAHGGVHACLCDLCQANKRQAHIRAAFAKARQPVFRSNQPRLCKDGHMQRHQPVMKFKRADVVARQRCFLKFRTKPGCYIRSNRNTAHPFTPTMRGSSARRAIVSGIMSTTDRPGML